VDTVQIVPTAEQYVDGFHAAVDVVARERRYLALVEGPPIEGSRAFVQSLLNGAGVQVLAMDSDSVVGWCDIVRESRDGFRHTGHLGMGVVPEFRGRGIGERLARAALDAAVADGMERIELEVFASNASAIALYDKLGFGVEGVKRRARKLDEGYEDCLIMAIQASDWARTARAR
jgi:ribosomal protein S18 acetylase RimI-like enzyme